MRLQLRAREAVAIRELDARIQEIADLQDQNEELRRQLEEQQRRGAAEEPDGASDALVAAEGERDELKGARVEHEAALKALRDRHEAALLAREADIEKIRIRNEELDKIRIEVTIGSSTPSTPS